MQGIIELIKTALEQSEIEAVVREGISSRNKVFELDCELKRRELAVPAALRATNPELAELREQLRQAREEYAAAEACMEAVKARHAAAVALTNLLAAMVQAGRDTQALEAAVLRALGQGAPAAEQAPSAEARQQAPQETDQAAAPAEKPAVGGNGASTGTFKVLECRPTKSGSVRAWCRGEEGHVAIYSVNGNVAKELTAAVGKAVSVKYRQGDKGLIALSVRLAG